MPRRPRFDEPGCWFHVMNRGLARRTVFETRQDVRYFNRVRRRDGPLFRGRFHSIPVLTLVYRSVLVRYIDGNPVQARLTPTPWSYPYGSAIRFAAGKVPRWLSTAWIEARIQDARRTSPGADYVSTWGARPSSAERALVEARISGRGEREDALDDLVGAAPSRVRDWMVRKASLADRTKPGVPCVAPAVVLDGVKRLIAGGRRWRYVTPKGQSRDAWNVALAGLLRDLAGLSHRAIAEHVAISPTMVARRIRAHAALCEDPSYATRAGRIAALCLRAAFPGTHRRVRFRS